MTRFSRSAATERPMGAACRDPGATEWRFVAIAMALVCALVPGQLQGQGDAGIIVGSRAPIVSVNDLDGKPVNLGQWIGKKPMLIEWWATWCENCETLLPRFQEARKLTGDRVEYIGINVTVNQNPERVRRYLQEHDMPFRVLYDTEGTSTRAYLAPATSFVVIVDSLGKVIYTGVGGDQAFEPALKRAAGVQN